MNAQLYTAASGLIVEERRLEMLANNLANVSTDGFRAQRTFRSILRGAGGGDPKNVGVTLAGSYETPGPGPLRTTGGPLDVVLGKDDFLEVRTPAGVRYTRSGGLVVNSAGELAVGTGDPVLGAGGRPIGGLGPGATITPDGRVLAGDAELGRIRVVRDAARGLRREGDGLYAAGASATPPVTVEDPALRIGALEGSTTDALTELVHLIDAQRAFESYNKLISLTMNEVNRRAIQEIAG